MVKVHEMSFGDFARMVKPSGATNRFPSIVNGMDYFSYSVYMNGPLAAQLPAAAQEFEFKDVMVHALAEKLSLSSESFRDNLKVAEIVATRSAWLAAVLEATLDNSVRLSDQVTADYSQLLQGLTHPWIVEELRKQKELSAGLRPALNSASKTVGRAVMDRAPDDITTGKVVGQSLDFTVQEGVDGKISTHENRRLETVPQLGQDVTVAYYRGNGQVFDLDVCTCLSPPFVDQNTGDLAVRLMDNSGRDVQVVLFSGLAQFEKFVKAQGLEPSFMLMAMDAREATPKVVAAIEMPKRELMSDVYLEEESGCLAVDYLEKGGEYSVLFGSVGAMESLAKDYGLSAENLAWGRALASEGRQVSDKDVDDSLTDMMGGLREMGFVEIQRLPVGGPWYEGKVVNETFLHVAQDLGRRVAVVHDLRDLDKVLVKGDSLTVKYENGRGRVVGLERDEGVGVGR